MFEYLIIGAGLSGCVFAERVASQLNKKVLIVDKRSHIGGNAYDYYNESGILVHKYGPHWFHTNDKEIFEYLSQFTKWRYHYHRVKSYVDGLLLPFPINMDTLNQLYGLNLKCPDEVKAFYESKREVIKNPKNSEEMVISKIGWDLYKKFFHGYTIKQWDIDPKDLAGSVTARIPVRNNRDDRYFTDMYQVMPEAGYTEMINKMIVNKNISIMLKTDYKDIIDLIKFNKIVYTGSVDEYFDNIFGKLPYRSLKFEHQTIDIEYYQQAQQVNYPNDYDFTRIVEWKHATGQKHLKTTITREYSIVANDDNEKYYPIPREENEIIYNKYKEEMAKQKSVLFFGRLADYKYYNMDQIVARALKVFEKEVKK